VHVAIVFDGSRMCVKAGASVNEQDVLTSRPLSHPCSNGQVNLIEGANLSHLVGIYWQMPIALEQRRRATAVMVCDATGET
jgi:hypothetical protein